MKQLLASAILAAVLLTPLAAEDGEKKPSANVGGVDAPGATITGIVKFSGPQPARKPVTGMLGNAFCTALYLHHWKVCGARSTLGVAFINDNGQRLIRLRSILAGSRELLHGIAMPILCNLKQTDL